MYRTKCTELSKPVFPVSIVKVCINAIRSTRYTVMFTWPSGCVVVSRLVRVAFIKALLPIYRTASSELLVLKGIGAWQYFIALSKSTSFQWQIDIARSFHMILRLNTLLLLLSSMYLVVWLNNRVLLWVIGL